MRKNRTVKALLCVGLMIICITGCGSSEDSNKTGEDAGSDDHVVTDTAVDENGMTAAREESGTDIPADAEQTAAKTEEEIITFEGLGLSVLGDSISTFDGYIPEGFAVFYPLDGKVTDVSQTWWMRLIKDTGMELCSNDSSSGSTCVGDSLSVDNPRYGCSGYRISLLTGKKGKMPDVIVVYMGTNDLLTGVPIGDNDGTQLVEEGMIENFSDAYTLILDKMASDYPAAQIYCCTLAPVGDWGTSQLFVNFVNSLGLTSADYSGRIRVIAENKGIPVIDLSDCGIEIDNLYEMTTDGVHLTPDGMECVERALLSGMGITTVQ